jgi:amino acid adenylation domain-containing protein
MLQNIFERNDSKAVALKFEDKEPYTYRKLNELANQLGREFLAQGIKLQQPVPVMLERSAEQVAVLLALSKIGAIYVPVSPEQPDPRLKQIFYDSKPTHIISSTKLRELRLSNQFFSSVNIVCLDKRADSIRKQETENLHLQGLHSGLICYIAYSSGTTGKPKGIPIKHCGMVEYWQVVLRKELSHRPSHVVSNCSIDFDAHIWEYLMAWVFGGRIHLTSEETRKSTLSLAAFILKHQITDMTLTPAVLREFSDAQYSAFAKNGLKAIYSTGEACTPEIVSRCERYGIKIYNCYGPTEATFGLSMGLCNLKNFHKKLAPIALPPPDSKVRIKIINENGQEVPEGVAGELVIYSPYICSFNGNPGYLNQKSDQFEKLDDLISYRTGDKFTLHGGLLYYEGRFDHLSNIKIRGQLVDPRGTEEVLRNFPEIKDVCVLVYTTSRKENLLVAYIISTKMPTIKQFRQFCHQHGLPHASIPSYFIPTEKFPLNSSGKIDRNLLAQNRFIPVLRDSSLPYEKPKTTLEERLIILWEEVLQIDPRFKVSIGVSDPFAYFGGDSIKLMILLRRLKERFGITLLATKIGSLEELTINKLAGLIRAEESIKLVKEGNPKLAPLFFLPPISGESSLTYAGLVDELKTNRKIYAIDAYEFVGSASFNSIPDLAKLCLDLIRKIQPEGRLYLLGWSSGGLLAYEITAQLEESNPTYFLGIIDEVCPTIGIASQSNEKFSTELLQLINYFGELYGFTVDIDGADLSVLPKERQINQVFSKIPELRSEINNMLTYVKQFLLMSLTYVPKQLTKTCPVIFSTESTRNQVYSTTHDSGIAKTLGWNQLAKQVHSLVLQGNHFEIITNPGELSVQLQGFLCSFKHEAQTRLYKIQLKATQLEESKRLIFFEKMNRDVLPLFVEIEESSAQDLGLKEKINAHLVALEKFVLSNLTLPIQKLGLFATSSYDAHLEGAQFIPRSEVPVFVPSKL